MISNRQKAILHIYASAAGIERSSYRSILRDSASVSSSTDPHMSKSGFVRAMSTIEDRLWSSVDAGLIDPSSLPRHVSRRGFWKSQLPVSRSMVSPAKLSVVWSLMDSCQVVLPGSGFERDSYLDAAITRSVGRSVSDLRTLTDRESSSVIECLRAILRRKGESNEHPTGSL